eukprot:TRINITY_DN4086_c1_g2_i1.p1 TRINITY_DN4086_c1_g2~~TRINITY_DN4086_c1_g2_i1.p1  ORF type:complete len:182 (-),score=49.26 TRINITY_DN4086_c1_g2_i1:9-554(-)
MMDVMRGADAPFDWDALELQEKTVGEVAETYCPHADRNAWIFPKKQEEFTAPNPQHSISEIQSGQETIQTGSAYPAPSPMPEISLQEFLQRARPCWSAKDLAAVKRKLSQIGVGTMSQLGSLLHDEADGESEMNKRLVLRGCKAFSLEALEDLRREMIKRDVEASRLKIEVAQQQQQQQQQ